MANNNMRGSLLSRPLSSSWASPLLGTTAVPPSLQANKISSPARKTHPPAMAPSLPAKKPSLLAIRAAASMHGSNGKSPMRRRQGLILSLSVVAATLIAGESMSREVVVGAYLPPVLSKSGFVQFQATSKDTPALRAGNVQPYSFFLPPTWKQTRVANILSGNYCQPKCAEPWVEVKFEDVKQGSVQVVASPLVRLTNKPNATIEEIGNPEKLISALGPFVTGNSYDPDEVVETRIEKRGTQTYYTYSLETPYARTGSHNLATATAKGNVVMLFVVSASDSQWSSSESTLRTMVESFQI